MSASLQADLAALAYLVSGVLFIMALRGLSSPATSRAGNRNGMIGMAIAVATPLWVAGGSCRRAGRGRRVLFTGSVRHRPGRRHPHAEPDRDEPRRRHRRYYLRR